MLMFVVVSPVVFFFDSDVHLLFLQNQIILPLFYTFAALQISTLT